MYTEFYTKINCTSHTVIYTCIMNYIMIAIYVLLWYSVSLLLARYFKILDKPGPDVPKRKRVPTIQWLTAILLVLWAVLVLRPWDLVAWWPFLWLRVGLGFIVWVTFIDELWRIISKKLRIGALPRLIVQIWAIAAAFLMSGVWITEFQLLNWTLIEFGPLTSLVFTAGWFLLFINAINWFDGIYGLATGMSSIWFLTIAWLLLLVVIPYYTWISPEKLWLLQDVSWYAIVFFIVTFVWAIIEFRPTWLMRDVWTMAFWFALAYLALLWWAKIGTMIVVLMLPLFDAVWVIIDRLHRRNKNPMKGDFSHLHYRLMALWWNRDEVRIAIRWLSTIFVILMLLQWTDRIGKVILFVMIACIFFGVNRYLFWKKWLPSEYDWRDHKHEKWDKKHHKKGKKYSPPTKDI